MRKYPLYIILFLNFFLILSDNVNSQENDNLKDKSLFEHKLLNENKEIQSNYWIDKGKFREIFITFDQINQILCTKDKKLIYAVTDTVFREIDFETGKIIREATFVNKYLQKLQVSKDEKTLCVFTLTNYPEYSSSRINIKIFQIDSMRLIKEVYLNDKIFDCRDPFGFTLFKIDIDYQFENNEINLNFSYDIGCDGSTTQYYKKGSLRSIKFLGDSITIDTLYKSPILDYKFINENTIALINSNYSSYSSKISNFLRVISVKNQLKNTFFQDNNEKNNNPKYRKLNALFYSKSKNHLGAWADNNYVYRWNLSDNLFIDSMKLEENYQNIAFTDDMKYLLGATSLGYKVFRFPNLQNFDFTSVNNYDFKHHFEFISDDSGFLVASKGYIRHFDYSKLTDIEENVNNSSELNIYPNPAKEYITINLESINRRVNPTVEGNVTIEIYDVMGVSIHSTPSASQPPLNEGNLRIDISNLTPGVYFLKIVGSNGASSIVEKFVKY